MEVNSNPDNIKKSLIIFLEMENIKYTVVEESESRVLIHLIMSDELLTMGCYIDYNIPINLIHFMSFAHQNIIESKRDEVLRLFSLLNNSMGTYWSTIHMNIDTGAVFAKSYLLVEDMEDVSLKQIERHFSINFHSLVNFLPMAMKINFGDKTARDVFNEFQEARETGEE